MTDVRTIDPTALPDAARQALGEAHRALGQGDAPKAQAAYRQAAEGDPQDPTVPFLMGGILRQAGQHMPALSLFLTAWRLAPHDPNARGALVAAFRGARFTQAAPPVVEALLSLLVANDVYSQDLAAVGLSLGHQSAGAFQPVMRHLFRRYGRAADYSGTDRLT